MCAEFVLQLNLSHNSIAYLTRNSFPSQESLRLVDLSHNQIPVLTSDFTHRLKKVEHLNFSHNIINEIREGIVTSLKIFFHYKNRGYISTASHSRWGRVGKAGK